MFRRNGPCKHYSLLGCILFIGVKRTPNEQRFNFKLASYIKIPLFFQDKRKTKPSRSFQREILTNLILLFQGSFLLNFFIDFNDKEEHAEKSSFSATADPDFITKLRWQQFKSNATKYCRKLLPS